jgi:hypothetical protein
MAANRPHRPARAAAQARRQPAFLRPAAALWIGAVLAAFSAIHFLVTP